MALVQAIAIASIVLILTPGWLFYFDVTPKVVVLLLGTAIAITGARRTPRLFGVLVLLSIVSLAASSAVSSNPGLSFFGTNWRRFGAVEQTALLLFAVALTGQAHRVRAILWIVTAATTIAALYGIAQYFGWDPILPAAGYHMGEGVWTIVRPPGTLGYVSYFATWLLVSGFLSLALSTKESMPVARRAAIAAAGIAWFAMFLTGTRAALLGLAAGLAIWLWRRGIRLTRRIAAITVGLLLAATVFYFSPAGWPLRSRTRWFIEDPWGGSRVLLWRDSLRMGAARLPLGYGPEVFSAAFPAHQSKELSRAYPDFAHESPHNMFLDALVAQGVAGPLLLAAFCLLGFQAARRIDNPWFVAALAAGIVSQQFTVFTVPTALILFTTIALAVGPTAASRVAEDVLAELRPAGHHVAQLGTVERDRVRRLDRHAGADRRLAGERRDVADERARVRLGDRDVLAGLAVDELDAAALDHVERRVAVGMLVQDVAGREALARPALGQPFELAVGQPGEQHFVIEIREALAAQDLRGRHANEATVPGPGPKREVGTRDSRGRGSGAAAWGVVMERAKR